MKLKTLKEIIKEVEGLSAPPKPNAWEHRLKQEATKWLRHFQNGDSKTDLQRQGIIEFILNFFNINDEDLKDGKK